MPPALPSLRPPNPQPAPLANSGENLSPSAPEITAKEGRRLGAQRRRGRRRSRLWAHRNSSGSGFLSLRCLCAAVLLAGGAAGCRRPEPPASPPKPVRTTVATRGAPGDARQFSVALQPRTQLSLVFKTGGYIESIAQRPGPLGELRPLGPGDLIKQGELLATLRRRDFDDQVAAAEGQLAQARAALERGEYEFRRATRLKEAASMTGTQFEAFRTGREAAAGAVQSATASHSQALQLRTDSAILAPFDGLVVQRLADTGELARPGATVFVVSDLSAVKAIFGVSDRLLPRIRTGDAITLRSETLHREFTGQIVSVAPAADPQSRLFPVEVLIPNPDSALKPGIVATALLPGVDATTAGAAVPLAALTRFSREAAAFAVFVTEGRGDSFVARERKVEVGGASGNSLLITAGLSPGESVVTLGLPGLRDGDAVVVMP